MPDLGKAAYDLSNITIQNSKFIELFPRLIGETDDTGRFQRAFDSITANGQSGILQLGTGKTYSVVTVNFSGRIAVEGNWATIQSVRSNSGEPMFKNRIASNELSFRHVYFFGDNPAIQNTLVGTQSNGVGIRINVQKCEFQGRFMNSKAILMRQNDFSRIQDCVFWNYARCIDIQGDYTANERDNTQIVISNISAGQCKLGIFLQGTDKQTIHGFDISKCGGGIYYAKDNKRINSTNCHVEFFGHPSYSGEIGFGYGLYMPDMISQTEMHFETCSALLPETSAIYGIYKGYNDQAWSDATFENCWAGIDDAKTGYRPVVLLGTYRWQGRWNYNSSQVITWTALSQWNDSTIVSYGNVQNSTANLLPFSRISSPEQLPATQGTGTMTVAAAIPATNTSGIANPTVAPTVSSAVNAGSTVPSNAYYIKYTWITASGETLTSPENGTFIATTGYNLVVTIPTLPAGATSAKIYISTSPGLETLQGSITTTTYTQSTPIVSGTIAPMNSVIRNAKLITISNPSSDYHRYVTVNLKVGWYTLIFGAQTLSGIPLLYVQNDSSLDFRLRTQFKSGMAEQFYRNTFHVDFDGTYRIGVEILNSLSSTFTLGQIELKGGFSYEYTSDMNRSRMSAQPALGYWFQDEIVDNTNVTELGTAASKYIIEGWRCIATGTPGTWVQRRSLTGN